MIWLISSACRLMSTTFCIARWTARKEPVKLSREMPIFAHGVNSKTMCADAMIDPRPTIEAPDDDPYLWLEEIDSERALSWVEAQNAATLARFGDRRFEADRDTLAAIYDRPDNIPVIARRGAKVFNFWKDAEHPRGLWRATTLDSYRNKEPDWDILLDLDAL